MEKTKESIKQLENEIQAFDFDSIKQLIPRYFVNHQQRFMDVQDEYNNPTTSNDHKQQSLYQVLIKQIYENKRLGRDEKELKDKFKQQEQETSKMRNEQKRLYDAIQSLQDFQNQLEEQNTKQIAENHRLELAIKETKKKQEIKFKNALEQIKQQKGINSEQLVEDLRREKEEISLLNDQIEEQEQLIKDIQAQYKEKFRVDISLLNDQKQIEKVKYYEYKEKNKQLQKQTEEFKTRYKDQIRQMGRNKQMKVGLDHAYKSNQERMNYVEKQMQELDRSEENKDLIFACLREDVEGLQMECRSLQEKKRVLEQVMHKKINTLIP